MSPSRTSASPCPRPRRPLAACRRGLSAAATAGGLGTASLVSKEPEALPFWWAAARRTGAARGAGGGACVCLPPCRCRFASPLVPSD
jgi:hypothetical protein